MGTHFRGTRLPEKAGGSFLPGGRSFFVFIRHRRSWELAQAHGQDADSGQSGPILSDTCEGAVD
jgi:hypothetical protein